MAIEGTLREFIRRELAGMYTLSPVIVESVDETNRRCEVSMKHDSDVILDNVPIASPSAGDNRGMIFPVRQDDEAFLLHSKKPLSTMLEERGHVDVETNRQFTVDDAILFPVIWNDEQTVPDHESGEMVYVHESGSIFRIKPDGSVRISTDAGEQGMAMESDGSFKLLDESGHGIESDGSGNFTWHAQDVNMVDSSTTLDS